MPKTRDSSRARLALQPSIPGRFLLDALIGFEHAGGNVEALLAAHQLSVNRCQLTGYRLLIRDYVAVLAAARRTMADEALGFLQQPVPLGAYRVFALGLAGARSLSELVEQARLFYRLFDRQLDFECVQSADSLALVLQPGCASGVDTRFVDQSILLHFLRLAGWLIGERIDPIGVQFRFTARAHEAHLNYLFGADVSYGAVRSELHIPAALGQVPVATNREQINAMLRQTDRMNLIPEHGRPFSREVRRQLLAAREAGWLSAGEVAAGMGLSAHQLWRKLQREGSQFQQLRDDIKRDWALSLVENAALSVADVAERLHFHDSSALHKAFQQWTGSSCSDYRQRLWQT